MVKFEFAAKKLGLRWVFFLPMVWNIERSKAFVPTMGSTCSIFHQHHTMKQVGFQSHPSSCYGRSFVRSNNGLHAEPASSSSSDSQQPRQLETTTTTETISSNDMYLNQYTNGGYTVKQRLREEVESPFRKVRLVFFGSSVASAMIALYFSMLNTIKATIGGYNDGPPLDEALTSDAINLGAAIICGVLAYREYQVGESNLARIARGGKLASLTVEPATTTSSTNPHRLQLSNYRRASRVLIAAGGEEYLSTLARSLSSDQLSDENRIPELLSYVDVVVVPVLLVRSSSSDNVSNNNNSNNSNNKVSVGDTKMYWMNTIQGGPEDRNFDLNRANRVISFPIGPRQWIDYLESEIQTANSQGFDVLQKGITLTVKKNGRILRRATGQPPWGDLIGTMEVMDGSLFGMPGDSERYGGRL
jgi:hypothetical protein